MIAWRRCGDHPEARQTGKLNCVVADCRASPIYQNLHQKGVVTRQIQIRKDWTEGVETEGEHNTGNIPKVDPVPGSDTERDLAVLDGTLPGYR